MANVDQKNDSKVDIFSASKDLFSASMALKTLNPKLSNDLLHTADALLKTIEKVDSDVDRYVELIRGEDWKLKQFEEDTLDILKAQRGFFNLELVTTNLCNFQCQYCFEQDYERTPETMNDKLDEILDRIDILLENTWFKQVFSGVNIDFWGGEPTINHEMIRKVCAYYKENPRVRFHIYTNGYNLDKIKDVFIEMNREGKLCVPMHKFTVQFSYDGKPVHDMTRTKNGKETSDRVLNNYLKLYAEGMPVTFKSAIMPDHFKHLPEVWDDFNEIYEMLIRINPKTNGRPINYSPTIDYFNSYDNLNLEELEKAMIEIAKREVAFYRTHGRFLTNWFNKDRTFCMAGVTMTTVDIDGQMYYCHGCLYKTGSEENKKELCFGSIYDPDFVDKLKYNFEERFLSRDKVDMQDCKDCEAIFCVRCNVLVCGRSEKEEFKDKWYDFSNQKNLCSYFKMISKIISATQKVLGGQ